MKRSSALRRSWPVALLVAAAECGPAVVARPVPRPAPLPQEPTTGGGGTVHWSFEKGLEGWEQHGGAPEPVCDAVLAARLPRAIQPTLGGDYWMTPIDVGQEGRCRLDTAAGSGAPVVLESPLFAIRQPVIELLVGGGGSPGTRACLRLEGSSACAFEEHGTGGLQMARVRWNVAALAGKLARVVVEDAAGEGILVDDVFDSYGGPSRPAPVWGFADTHTHPVSQLSFGRHVFVGSNDGPIEDALASCVTEHGKDGMGGKAGLVVAGTERSFNRLLGHRTTGYPDFDGWPRSSTLVHQQMYIDWIKRAWEGGLRLLVAHVTNNEQLAAGANGVTPFDDTNVVESGLEELTALAARHSDFIEIAPTSADARRIIGQGRLAVVLGVEVDAIGGCRRDEDCDEEKAIAAVDWLFKIGARHVFPVHLSDNAFAGSSIWYNGVYDLLNWYLRGAYQTVDHDDSVAFTLSNRHQWYPVWFAAFTGFPNRYGGRPYNPPFHDYESVPAGHVNARGLTGAGRALLREMHRLGLIVDIDHMGERSRAETLAMFSDFKTPVAMGHTWFRDLGYDRSETDDWLKLRNEIMKTSGEIEVVRRLGGIVSPITNQHDVRQVDGSGHGNDCEGSSTSWLQAYVYAVERMGGAGVGPGTDFNGLPGQPLPRFGPYACTGREMVDGGPDGPRRAPGHDMLETVRADADAQTDGVVYDVPIRYARTNRFYGPIGGDNDPYTPEERAVWIAEAQCEANAIAVPDGDLTNATPRFARAPPSTPPRDIVVPVASGLCGLSQNGAHDWWQAATLVRAGGRRPSSSLAGREFDLIKGIDDHWKQMECHTPQKCGNREHPLKRMFYDAERGPNARHDADINLDGLAQYGLMPDFFQDVSNQLASRGATSDLSALFRSAETYLEMWARVEASAGK